MIVPLACKDTGVLDEGINILSYKFVFCNRLRLFASTPLYLYAFNLSQKYLMFLTFL